MVSEGSRILWSIYFSSFSHPLVISLVPTGLVLSPHLFQLCHQQQLWRDIQSVSVHIFRIWDRCRCSKAYRLAPLLQPTWYLLAVKTVSHNSNNVKCTSNNNRSRLHRHSVTSTVSALREVRQTALIMANSCWATHSFRLRSTHLRFIGTLAVLVQLASLPRRLWSKIERNRVDPVLFGIGCLPRYLSDSYICTAGVWSLF